jgi:hypothetical protein
VKAAFVIPAVLVLGLVTPVLVIATSRRMHRQVSARRGDLPAGETTPELVAYSRVLVSHGRWAVGVTFLFALLAATVLAWVVSGSAIAGIGAFVAVMVMWSFSSLTLRVFVARKASTHPPAPGHPLVR